MLKDSQECLLAGRKFGVPELSFLPDVMLAVHAVSVTMSPDSYLK